MATTLTQLFPYPGPNDDPDVPYWLQRLAEALDSSVKTILDRLGVTEKGARGILARIAGAATKTVTDGNWKIMDVATVNVVKDRWYEATIFTNSICLGGANVAIAVDVRQSVKTDVTEAGSSVDQSYTLWTAPVAGSGKSHVLSFQWKAAATDSLNFKAVACRAVGTGGVDLQVRKLTIRDLGANL